MPGASNRIDVYKDLVEFVLGQHKDLVSRERLNLFLGKSKKRYPQLGNITIQDNFTLKLTDDFLVDEDAALRCLSVVIACVYKVLEMFVGSGTARERVLASVDKFKLSHPELDSPELKKYLPKRGEAEDKVGSMEVKSGKDIDPEGTQAHTKDENRHRDPITTEDILRPKDEGLPFYDEVRKEWVIKPASEVKRFKEEHMVKVAPGVDAGTQTSLSVRPKKKADELPVDPLSWLQEEFNYGMCLMVEGTGQEKNMLCAEFVKEGLESGEDVIVILGYPPKVFFSQLQKLGVLDKDIKNVYVIDWATFKERQVYEVETAGNVRVAPKDPKFIGSALTAILASLDKAKKKRAFVSIVSYALAFIDFETIYNFVQVTRLKFRKSRVMGVFTLEAGQHGKDVRDSFSEISDGWLKVKEGMSGANTWKMKADLIMTGTGKNTLKDVVIMRNGVIVLERKAGVKEDALGIGVEEISEEEVVDVEKEETLAEKRIERPKGVDQYLMDKIEMWRGLGFSVKILEDTVSMGEDAVKVALQDFDRRAGKALEIRGKLDELSPRLRSLRDLTLDDDALEVRKGLKDLGDLNILEQKVVAIEAAVKERLEKETRRRDREKDIFRIRMEHWARQGYNTTRLDQIIDKDLETVNLEFAAFRSIVNRLKRMEEELDKMTLKGHELDVQTIRKRLFDVEMVDETERMFNRIRESVMVKERIQETAKGRRNELMDEMFQWALEGYCVELIDQVDIFREDLATLEARLGRLRARIGRLKRVEDTINGMDMSAHKEEEREIRSMLKDVDRVDDVEKKVMALQESMKGRISPDVMAIDANIEKVKELEETWQKLKARLLAEGRTSLKEGKDGDGGGG